MTQVLINPVPPQDQQGRVDAVFAQVKEVLGFVPAGLKLYAISPPLLEAFVANVGYFRQGTALPGPLTAMIRYHVSERAGCQFCIDLNEGFLQQMGIDLDAIRASRDNIEQAPLKPAERQLLSLAVQSVTQPEAVQAEHIQAAREAGWSDRDIFDAVAQAASNRAFNHVLKTFNLEDQSALV